MAAKAPSDLATLPPPATESTPVVPPVAVAPVAVAPAPEPVAAAPTVVTAPAPATRTAPVAVVVSELDDEPVALRREARATVLASVVVNEAPAVVGSASPSTPPWTREVELADEMPADHEIAIPGVRRASRPAKVVVAASVAVAALICVTAGLHSLSTHQQRSADEARRQESVAAVAVAPTRLDAIPPPVAAPPPTDVAPSVGAAAAPAAGTVDETTAPASLPEAVSTAGAAGTPADRELPIQTTLHTHGQSALVVAAEQALVRGATDRALVLANQAVNAAPADADAWLTLGAAHRAAGNDAAAREDYRQCVAQALTEGKNHCRVLAAR